LGSVNSVCHRHTTASNNISSSSEVNYTTTNLITSHFIINVLNDFQRDSPLCCGLLMMMAMAMAVVEWRYISTSFSLHKSFEYNKETFHFPDNLD